MERGWVVEGVAHATVPKEAWQGREGQGCALNTVGRDHVKFPDPPLFL